MELQRLEFCVSRMRNLVICNFVFLRIKAIIVALGLINYRNYKSL